MGSAEKTVARQSRLAALRLSDTAKAGARLDEGNGWIDGMFSHKGDDAGMMRRVTERRRNILGGRTGQDKARPERTRHESTKLCYGRLTGVKPGGGATRAEHLGIALRARCGIDPGTRWRPHQWAPKRPGTPYHLKKAARPTLVASEKIHDAQQGQQYTVQTRALDRNL
ncbi:hypothetical protein FA13DRAFT_1871113 [Coprinellus micaceus]|uniref:Uncharacterized protein n=1 Tax=Coprinellus micaceus TaxID=71717 RepID=A0A4Y7T3U3_COPMI|nr:hypothetical protein FA13DRAFT_1871113 [Coprinellus micaceus]